MAYNYPPEYYKLKAKEQKERDKAKGIKPIHIRVKIEREAAIKEINKAWMNGHKVKYQIGDGAWQGDV